MPSLGAFCSRDTAVVLWPEAHAGSVVVACELRERFCSGMQDVCVQCFNKTFGTVLRCQSTGCICITNSRPASEFKTAACLHKASHDFFKQVVGKRCRTKQMVWQRYYVQAHSLGPDGCCSQYSNSHLWQMLMKSLPSSQLMLCY